MKKTRFFATVAATLWSASPALAFTGSSQTYFSAGLVIMAIIALVVLLVLWPITALFRRLGSSPASKAFWGFLANVLTGLAWLIALGQPAYAFYEGMMNSRNYMGQILPIEGVAILIFLFLALRITRAGKS